MRTRVADTSLETYHSLPVKDYLQPKEMEVMDLLRQPCARPMTREQIAQRLGWKESAVCGRCNSLVAKGALIELDGGKTASGRSAKLLKVPGLAPQAELFQ